MHWHIRMGCMELMYEVEMLFQHSVQNALFVDSWTLQRNLLMFWVSKLRWKRCFSSEKPNTTSIWPITLSFDSGIEFWLVSVFAVSQTKIDPARFCMHRNLVRPLEKASFAKISKYKGYERKLAIRRRVACLQIFLEPVRYRWDLAPF